MKRARAIRSEPRGVRVTRRRFSRGLGALALGATSPFARAFRVSAHLQSQPKTLVFVHLRGGADGLSLLVPEGDPAYARLRSCTRIEPGASATGGASLALERGFGLPESMAALGPLFRARELSAWPAVGFRTRPRSHGDAETRLFAALASRVDDAALLRLDSRARPFPGWSLRAQLEHLARRIGNGDRPAVAWVEHPGWDTHAAQRARLPDQQAELCDAVLHFRALLGAGAAEVAIAIASEFGRSVYENASSGTDDGHAGAAFLLAGGAGGGRVYGRWAGLVHADPETGALAPSTDSERWIAALVRRYVASEARRRGANA